MTAEELFSDLKNNFSALVRKNQLESSSITIEARALSPQEAIGDTRRKDFPILDGKEIMLEAEFEGAKGQAFTSSPADFSGSLADVLNMDIAEDSHARGLFIATMNAVLCKLGLTDHTVHCKNDEPEQCAQDLVAWLRTNYGQPRITLVGYQPAMIENLSPHFELRVLDLNPANVGQTRYNVAIEHGTQNFFDATDWAELILCTGSTLCNGTITDFLSMNKEVVYFGTTIAGAASMLGLKRLCLYSV